MAGLYRISNVVILGRICDIQNGPFCDNWRPALLFPRTSQHNCKKIFLAINIRRDNRGGPGDIFNQFILTIV